MPARSLRALATRAADVLISPLTLASAVVLWVVRRAGVRWMPVSRAIFARVGVFPVRRHYYEPLFDARELPPTLGADRPLPGIDLRAAEQLALLRSFPPRPELERLPARKPAGRGFYYENGAFEAGDAEFLYQVVRHFRPRRIVEIGSGMSTLLVRQAIEDERAGGSAYRCDHVCIEPYENAWLRELDVELVRQPVQKVDLALFARLAANDVLFIDSSHVIRPGGDVVREYLEILPLLRAGVLVHVHDIFTPRDYPAAWLRDEVRFWNEQYLVEALLSGSTRYEVLAALNYLARHHPAALAEKCPAFARRPQAHEPGSLWLRVRSDPG